MASCSLLLFGVYDTKAQRARIVTLFKLRQCAYDPNFINHMTAAGKRRTFSYMVSIVLFYGSPGPPIELLSHISSLVKVDFC
jgi:hypothetical protein